jgi:YVTN family beta-propeller protein
MLKLLFALLGTIACAHGDTSSFYQANGEISFGGQGGWDDLSADPASHRLFVSHSDRVVVIDTDKNVVIKEILETPGVHGIAIAHDLKKAFSSNGKEGKVSVINLDTLATSSKIQVGENPDAIVYEPSNQEVYAFNGRSHSVSVIDAKSEKVTMAISLPGKPEFAAVDPAAHRVFVNIEDKNSILAIDTERHKIASTWVLDGCESPSGLAIDAKNHRLFSACENQKMVMVNSETGRTITSIPTGEGTDGAAFDPLLGLLFSPNGKSGTITIAREKGTDRLVVIQTLKSQVGARTMTLDPKNHRIFLPTADLQASVKGARPKAVDGTQRVLTFAPKGD